MMHRCMNTFLWSCKLILLSLILVLGISERALAQYFPIHATVQWPAPQSPYLADYSTAGRDRLIVTLLNRDQQQPLLFAKLRLQLKSGGFTAKNREEVAYPMLELNTGVPFRLTGIDLAPYLQPQNLQSSGNLRNGQLPTGYAELSVQVIDYYTGRPLSDWHTARAYLDVKKPPFLNLPEQDAQVALRDPLFIRFQWTPRHQGLSGTEYEFVLKELPDNGVAPQSAFAYGQEIYRTHTRSTSLSYTHLDPLLLPNRRYAWQVRALAREGVNEVGMFEHGGYSEISWFTLNDRCDAPRDLKAQPRFAKVDLSWSKVLGTTGYVVECRPKTKLNVYEWAQTEAAGEQLTLARLKPGWTYEWRVGTRCTADRPVFSEVREFTLSKYDENLLAACGKEPVRSDLAREPHLDIRAGDVVTIGGDYPMTITEVTPLGDGWYAGKGKTRLKTIIDAPIALRFDRLRINVDKYQIDGTVEAAYDEGKGKIANTDYIDDGGKDLRPATLRIREQKLGYSLPESPRFLLKTPKFFQEGGNFLVETQDADGHPQTIQLELQEGADYKSVFPMTVTDAEGNSYRIQPEESSSQDETSTSQGQIALKAERVAPVGDFNADVLSKKYGQVRFERGPGKYAFDDGKEKWYRKSVKLDRFYKPFAKDYIAPWKLIPEGETDVVTAHYEGKQRIDVSKLVFTSDAKSPVLPSSYDETSRTWSIKLPSVASGSAYDVFAVYEGEVLGKLHVVSYAKQRHKVTLVPINDAKLDKTHIERELNAVYTPVGVHFDVEVDERMRGDYSWEVPGEEDKQLSLVGKSFWGYDKELKESTEMLQLQQAYQAKAGTLDGAYLFVLDGAKGLSSSTAFLQGEMPRKSRFGYLFSNDGEQLSKTIAHELGHGLFTLRHTFDSEYAGKKSQGTSSNLMDYAEGTSLAAFQWNVMASPAIFTAVDQAEEGELRFKKGEFLGFAPNGQVVAREDKPLFYSEKPYFITGFKLYNGTIYKWNGDKFVDSNGKAYNLSLRPVTGKVAIWRKSNHPECYILYKFIKVENYTSAQFKDILDSIVDDNGQEWQADLVENASENCLREAKEEIKTIASLGSAVHFVGKASELRSQILSALSQHEKNTFTGKEIGKDVSIIISIDGDDSPEISSLKNQKNSYLHLIFTIKHGKVEFLRMETSDKFRDKLSDICKLIKNKPWAAQAIILYEVADLLDQGIEYLKIPESVWGCTGKDTLYKQIVASLLELQNPILMADKVLGQRLSAESKFAFVCGLWNGTVEIVQSVPQIVKLLTCVLHPGCTEGISSKWASFKRMQIYDDQGALLCDSSAYLCKGKELVVAALSDLVADDCKVAHTVGSVVGPVAVMCVGDAPAAEAVIARLGKVGSGLKYAIKGLQLCDRITNVPGLLAKGLKVSAALVKKAGKLLPEIRIGGKTVLHYVGDKLRIRRFDAVTKQTIDEPIEESVLSDKLSELSGKAENSVDKPSDAVVKPARIADERIVRGESNAPSRSQSPEHTAQQKESVQGDRNLGQEPRVKGLSKLQKLFERKDIKPFLQTLKIKNQTPDVESFMSTFKSLHREVEKAAAGSIKSLDEVAEDLEYLLTHHLATFRNQGREEQMSAFINEMMQTKDKFKAGATTLEVVRHPEKYISAKYSKRLSDLELEDLISHAAGSGNFRFDAKWKVKNRDGKEIDIFVDTKNYSRASNMFGDLGQFKAYLREIDSFDKLYIIQQGGRGVTREQIIDQLERAIAKDAKSVFNANRNVWINMGIGTFADLERICRTQGLSSASAFQIFRNIIQTTN